MSISMQGAWSVSVKAKSADLPHRFIISGATSGNGTYTATPSTAAVNVTGSHWTISIQHNPGTGFINSSERLKFPTVSSGMVRFDIESNDSVNDQDFDDLILTCSTPQSATEFVVYGTLSAYDDGCISNPCSRNWIVIDSRKALIEALKNPHLKELIEKVYPERVLPPGPRPPGPDPSPLMKSLVLPLTEQTLTPSRQVQVLTSSLNNATTLVRTNSKAASAAKPTVESDALETFSTVRTVEKAVSTSAKTVEYNRLAVAGLLDHLHKKCTSNPLPGYALRFHQYDRTSSELAGGAYSGAGDREVLGTCATDMNGNYIYRFSRSIAWFLGEADVDVALAEDEVAAAMPDVVVQVVDPMSTVGYLHETSPAWNVPNLKRINVCIPRSKLGALGKPCGDQLIVQSIGNIFIGAHQSDGSRVGFNNVLSPEGRITARNLLGPTTQCAGWAGSLDLRACLLNTSIRWYTIRYRRDGESDWKFFQQTYRHPRQSHLNWPAYDGDLVGPFDHALQVDGGTAQTVKAYKNIQVEAQLGVDWLIANLERKAQIWSWVYEAGVPGSFEFRIEGYKEDGSRFTGADDTITLFIDNQVPERVIAEVVMPDPDDPSVLQLGGDCALFTLPADHLNTPLRVRFRAHQVSGLLQSYGISMRKGNTSTLTIAGSGPGAISGTYAHGDDLSCTALYGTMDDPTQDGTGYVTAHIAPTSGGWLTASQSFCTFVVNLTTVKRVTTGYDYGTYEYGPTQYLLGIQK